MIMLIWKLQQPYVCSHLVAGKDEDEVKKQPLGGR